MWYIRKVIIENIRKQKLLKLQIFFNLNTIRLGFILLEIFKTETS